MSENVPDIQDTLDRLTSVLVDALVAEENVTIVTDQIRMLVVKDKPCSCSI